MQTTINITLPPGPEDTPFVITFYRTTSNKTSINFEVKSRLGMPTIPRKTVTLVDLKATKPSQDYENMRRRLSEVSIELPAAALSQHQLQHQGDHQQHQQETQGGNTEEGRICEDFFLSDGRDPVAMPDTWEEARAAFKGICESEGASPQQCLTDEAALFEGGPRDHTPWVATKTLCDQLSAYAVSKLKMTMVSARRLKGGGTTGNGGQAANSYSNARNPGLGSYGYGMSRMKGAYPMGVAKTGYGYAGRSRLMTGFLAFGFLGLGFGSMGAYSRHRYRQQTSDTECADGGADCTEEGGKFKLASGQEVYRDDLMEDTGFSFGEVSGGISVTIYSITSEAFNSSVICPPANWKSIGWEPSRSEDLFISVTSMESIEHDDWTGLIVAAVIFLSMIICSVGACILCNKKARHARTMDGMMKRRNGCGSNNPPGGLPRKVVMPGQRYVLVHDNLGCCYIFGGSARDQSNSVTYDLDISPEGQITGRCNEGGYSSTISGKMRWLGGQAEVHWVQSGTVSGEVEGFIMPGPNDTQVLRADIVGFMTMGDRRSICRGSVHCQTGGTGVVIGQVIGN